MEIEPTASPPTAQYAVTLDEQGVLSVTLDAQDGVFAELAIEDGAEEFVRDLQIGPRGGTLVPLSPVAWPFKATACAGPCTVRYRFDLRLAAERFEAPQYAGVLGGAILSPPTTWLLRPSTPGAGSFSLTVEVPRDQGFVSGLRRNRAGQYEARMDDLPQAPYAAFGTFVRHEIQVGPKTVELVRVGPEPDIGDAALKGWATRASQDVASYFGGFAPQRAIVLALVEDGRAVSEGTALGNGGASIIVHVGSKVAEATLAEDWILTHEMVHLSMPGLSSRHRWLEEGLATYVEPIARARVGRLGATEVWGEWVLGMKKGQPAAGDGGLDGTESWGRIYWGGAAFWLQAEVAIAQKTDGKKGVRDCMRRVVMDGGSIESRWSVRRFLQSCDAAIGEPIVERLYDAVASEPIAFDLDGMFARLGVRKGLIGVEFDDHAPDATVRRALLAPDGVAARPQRL